MIVTPRPCVICRDPFTPVKRSGGRWSETCGKRRCRSLLGVRRDSWQAGIARASAAKSAQHIARINALVASQFGELSDRERAIFAFAHRDGYDRGYATAYAPIRRGTRRCA